MRRRIGLIAAVCFAFCLCFALVGCGANNKAGFVGSWDIESGSSENMSASSIEVMKKFGMNITMTLKDDGTGSMDLVGEHADFTWEATSASEGKMTVQGNETKLKLADGKLMLEQSDGTSMTFAKSDGSAAAASPASTSASASASSAASSEAASPSSAV